MQPMASVPADPEPHDPTQSGSGPLALLTDEAHGWRLPLDSRYQGWRLAVKRSFDLVGALVLLVVLSPLAVVGAVAVAATGGRPILFRQQRVGRHGRPFTIYKLRTMRADADDVLQADRVLAERHRLGGYKLELWEDPRITPVGRHLRRFSIDELPQLINVVRGDMSLVGPRPIVPSELTEYGDYAPAYLAAWPGITGAWQVAGRDEVKYPERAALDAAYVAGWSLATDPIILLRTVPAALGARGVR